MARRLQAGFCFGRWLCCAALGLLGVASSLVAAVEVEVASTRPWKAIPARLYEPEGAQLRLLDRFRGYLERQQWEDAWESAESLLQATGSTVVAIDDRRYIGLHDYVHRQLANQPATVLDDYRALVDAPAEAWYRQGVAERDSHLLRRVVNEMFCSRWGDDALYALGELALEQGEYLAARFYWSRISRKLQTPNNTSPLVYPDTELNLSDIAARLVLVSIYEGDLGRAQDELELFAQSHSNARGWFGGHDVVYSEALAEMIEKAEFWPRQVESTDWLTFAGMPSRANRRLQAVPATFSKLWSHPLVTESKEQPSVFPIVIGELLIYQDGFQVEALRLDSGSQVFSSLDTAYQSPQPASDWLGELRYLLTGNGERVFGTTTAPLSSRRFDNRSRYASALWGLDLKREGALSFRWRTGIDNTSFVGAPIVIGDRLWVALQAGERTMRSGIACYDLATREQVWQHWVCQANTPATGWTDEHATNLLSYDSGVVYVCTNLGAIGAYRADDGQPLWITTYERTSEPVSPANVHPYYRGPNPPVLDRGWLFVLPPDGRELLAIDAATGYINWRKELVGPQGHILAVADGALFVSDNGLRSFDSRTGAPLIEKTELRLTGQPVLVGKTIFGAMDRVVRSIDAATGAVAEQELQLPESGGANLLVSGDYLIAAGPSQLTVYRVQATMPETFQDSQEP